MKKFQITVNGNAYDVEVEEVGAVAAAPAAAPVAAPVAEAAPAAAPAPVAAPAAAAPAAGYQVKCPMPGTIVDVKVQAGATVKNGDVLVVFEAMKMENEVMADRDGVVSAVCVNKGDSVETDTVLLTIN